MSELVYQRPEILKKVAPGSHAVIEASAGTGKTYVIERLFADLVLLGRCEPDKILVVTFTEKATGELRGRVRGTLEAILRGEETQARQDHEPVTLDAAARERLYTALNSFERVPVFTIHGFCQRILTDFAFLTGTGFALDVVDSRGAFHRAFRDEMRESLAVDEETSALLSQWMGTDEDGKSRKVDDLEQLLYEAHRRRYLALEPAAGVDDANSFLSGFDAAVLEDAYENAAIRNADREAAKGAITRLEKLARSCGGSAERLLGELEKFDLTPMVHPRGANGGQRRVPFPDGLKGPEREQIDFLNALHAITLAKKSLEGRILDKFLPPTEQRLERDKRERGEIDYDDMLALVWNALDGPRGQALAEALCARYRYALLDEFQDTDDLQWRIFHRVFMEGNAGNVLYVVGDPKQAIYGFRGADVFTYLQAKSEILETGAKDVPLTKNFRSTRDVVDALNAILDQSASSPLFDGEIKYDHPVECGKPKLVARIGGKSVVPVTVMHYRPPLNVKDSAPARRRTLGRRIAATIRHHLNDPAHKIEITGEGGDARTVAARDIFILTRSNGEADEIGGYLREAGVPFAFYKRDGLFQTSEAGDILDVLRAIEDPSDRSRKLKAWATPFFDVPFRDLAAFGDLAPDHPLLQRLYDWSALAERERFADLFSSLLHDSGLVDRELFLSDSERELTNYLHIFEILLEQARQGRLSLGEIVALLEGYIAEKTAPPGADGNVQRLETERKAVQVMTVHMSKGLEADVVFLFGGFNKGPNRNKLEIYHRDARVRFAFGDQRKEKFIKERLQREEKEENQRLLYVGMTRARAKLYLPLFDDDLKGYYGAINDRLGEMFSPGKTAPAQRKGLFSVEEVAEAGSASAIRPASDNQLLAWSPPEKLLDGDSDYKERKEFLEAAAHHRPFTIESYTSLHALAGAAPPNIPVEEFKTDLAATDEGADLRGGRNVGVFLHEVIERLDMESFRDAQDLNSWKAREDVAALLAGGMRRHQVREPEWMNRGAEIVYNTMTSSIAIGPGNSTPQLWRLRSVREMEFICPIPEGNHPRFGSGGGGQWKAERGYLKGFVDFVFEHDGLTYFADWKSDLLRSYDAATIEKHVAENYSLQAKIYCVGVLRLLRIRSESEYQGRFGGLVYVFLRGTRADGDGRQGVYFHRPRWSEVCAYESELMATSAEAMR